MPETTPLEEWRPIVGWEDLYEVSSFGRVRSWRSPGKQALNSEPRILKAQRDNAGYLRIALTKRHRGQKRWVHRLVLEAFVGPRPDGMATAHLNGIRDDCRLVNLAWKTPKENHQDRFAHGTVLFGDRHPTRRLSADDVREIRRAVSAGVSKADLARRFNVSHSAVTHAVSRKNWKHLSSEAGSQL